MSPGCRFSVVPEAPSFYSNVFAIGGGTKKRTYIKNEHLLEVISSGYRVLRVFFVGYALSACGLCPVCYWPSQSCSAQSGVVRKCHPNVVATRSPQAVVVARLTIERSKVPPTPLWLDVPARSPKVPAR